MKILQTLLALVVVVFFSTTAIAQSPSPTNEKKVEVKKPKTIVDAERQQINKVIEKTEHLPNKKVTTIYSTVPGGEARIIEEKRK